MTRRLHLVFGGDLMGLRNGPAAHVSPGAAACTGRGAGDRAIAGQIG